MAWHKERADSEVVVREVVFGDERDVDFVAHLAHGVDLDALLEIVGDGDDLGMVALHVHLLDLTLAEACDVTTEEVLEQDSVLLKVAGGQEACIHYYVVGLFVVAEDRHQMLRHKLWVKREVFLVRELFRQIFKLFKSTKETIVKIFDHDFIIASIVN